MRTFGIMIGESNLLVEIWRIFMLNLELIDKEERKKIAKRFLPLIKKFYGNPENQKKFEKWKIKISKE